VLLVIDHLRRPHLAALCPARRHFRAGLFRDGLPDPRAFLATRFNIDGHVGMVIARGYPSSMARFS